MIARKTSWNGKEREVKETLPRRRLLSSNFRGIPRSRRCCRLVLAATAALVLLMGGEDVTVVGSLGFRRGLPIRPDAIFDGGR